MSLYVVHERPELDRPVLVMAPEGWIDAGLGGGAALGSLLAPDVLLVRLLLSQAGLWTGLLGACRVVSRRFGTRSATTPAGSPNSNVGPNWQTLISAS